MKKNQIQLLVLSLFLLLVLFLCVDGCERSEVGDAVDIAESMQERLSDSLNDTFATLLGHEGGYGDGDQDPDVDEELCCVPGDPCSLSDNQVCDCKEMDWDVADCPIYSTSRRLSARSDPICVPDPEACMAELSDAPDVGEVIDELKLGWFSESAPDESGGPSTFLCFSSPYSLEDEAETILSLAYDSSWQEVAAAILVLNEVQGHGLLPINECGALVLPGLKDLCRGMADIDFTLNGQTALMNFTRDVGSYQEFTLQGHCD